MKRVFICSPLRNEDYLTYVKNKENARNYCRFAAVSGVSPFAPHVFCTEFLNDSCEIERKIGIDIGISFLSICDELWVFANFKEDISEGMKKEIEYFQSNFPDRKIRYFATSCAEQDELISKLD